MAFVKQRKNSEVKKATKELGVKMVPYQVRHSGPSWDALQKTRTLAEIQKRGCWVSARSVVRYEKGGRIMADYALLSRRT